LIFAPEIISKGWPRMKNNSPKMFQLELKTFLIAFERARNCKLKVIVRRSSKRILL